MANHNNQLLSIKGPIKVHFMDNQTLEGEFATQDAFNIFLVVNDEPHMIPRNQIRFIKGSAGQEIGPDTSTSNLSDPPVEVEDGTAKTPHLQSVASEASMWDTDVMGTQDSTSEEVAVSGSEVDDSTATFLQDEDDPEDSTMLLESVDDDDSTVFFETDGDEEDDVTMLLDEMDEDEATLLFEENQPSTPVVTAYFACTGGPHAGENFNFQPGVTTLGRSSDNIFALFKDKEISRRHALITQQPDGTFVIEDRGSLNGVIINDVRIEAPYTLKEGDHVLIGVSILIYHDK
ncbi:MAG: FHA domain-containing protein [Anaerolineae bacterium]|nr:FHA domain-containing protein [Anaerolineae bacterium]